MPSGYVGLWLKAFLFTQLVEIPIYCAALGVSIRAAAGASAITHPVLWFLVFPLLPLPYWSLVVVGELWAWSAESAYFALVLKRPKAWFWSFVANGASFGTGLLSRYLFGAP